MPKPKSELDRIFEKVGIKRGNRRTKPNTFTEAEPASLLKEQVDNRDCTGWPTGQHIVLTERCDEIDTVLKNWVGLTSKDADQPSSQMLYVPLNYNFADKIVYQRYDAKGHDAGRGTLFELLKVGGLKVNVCGRALKLDKYLAAIRTKPFILLAGISGTGKSWLVRQLARGFCPTEGPLADEQKPGNFSMIQVRPNWHDSSELLGYVSRVSGTPEYVVKDFVKFLVKAWMYPKVPFFLCLDEMNLAPVEQYFAEYLSVIETRQIHEGKIVTDPLVTFEDAVVEQVSNALLKEYASLASGSDEEQSVYTEVKAMLETEKCIRIPSNLVVMGTVNMDETTFSFSRKVLDRAMSFELNEVNMREGLEEPTKTTLGSFQHDGTPLQTYIEANEVYPANQDLCDKVLDYLEAVNAKLDKTPFKIAYRSRNEIMVYCVERTKGGGVELTQALDEATSMKILSRIEGDRRRLSVDNARTLLDVLDETIDAKLKELKGDGELSTHICHDKLEEMKVQLKGGYTSFWTR